MDEHIWNMEMWQPRGSVDAVYHVKILTIRVKDMHKHIYNWFQLNCADIHT
jgi:hypothetical protein